MRLSGQSILAAVRPADRRQDKGATRSPSRASTRPASFTFGYTVPNLLIDHAMRNTHVPPGFWRGVNINQNCIFIECFMDELAQAAGQDALEFRRKLMGKHPAPRGAQCGGRTRRLGQAGAAGRPSRPGAHEGVQQLRGGLRGDLRHRRQQVKVHRIVGATDPGYAVNPAQIERQVAGSFVYGLSALFYQECTVKDGRIEQTNFDTYDSMRIAQMPKVESILMPSGGTAMGRGGRADDLRGRAGRAQRLFPGDRQAHPLDPAEEPQFRSRDRPRRSKAIASRTAAASAAARCEFPAPAIGASAPARASSSWAAASAAQAAPARCARPIPASR